MMFGKKMEKGSFILYRENDSQNSELKPARLQSNFRPGAIAVCDITGIVPPTADKKARIVCGPVRWLDSYLLKIFTVSENALLSAPTSEGVKE